MRRLEGGLDAMAGSGTWNARRWLRAAPPSAHPDEPVRSVESARLARRAPGRGLMRVNGSAVLGQARILVAAGG
jgi:hypothetical protein